jgi:peptidyl-tRNA hydrolase
VRPDHPLDDLTSFVLSTIPKRDRETLDHALDRAADAIEVVLAEGVERAMALFNERVKPVSET